MSNMRRLWNSKKGKSKKVQVMRMLEKKEVKQFLKRKKHNTWRKQNKIICLLEKHDKQNTKQKQQII